MSNGFFTFVSYTTHEHKYECTLNFIDRFIAFYKLLLTKSKDSKDSDIVFYQCVKVVDLNLYCDPHLEMCDSTFRPLPHNKPPLVMHHDRIFSQPQPAPSRKLSSSKGEKKFF